MAVTWFKLDDGFPEHPKIARVGGDAAWLYVCGLAYASRNLTDGLIPAGALARLSDRKQPQKLAQVLVKAGLWDVHEDGWMVHDYLEHQTSRAKVDRDREQARQRMARRRGSQDVRANMPGSSGEVRQPDTDSDTDTEKDRLTNGSSSVIHRPESSSSFAHQVTALAAEVALGRVPYDVGNKRAWIASTARRMLTERAPQILEAHERGMSVPAAAEFILTDPVPTAVTYCDLESARTFGRSVKHQHLTGDNADLPDANRRAFLEELPAVEWGRVAMVAYDEYEIPRLRVVEGLS